MFVATITWSATTAPFGVSTWQGVPSSTEVARVFSNSSAPSAAIFSAIPIQSFRA
jgi:hypothetical protein